MADFNLIIKAVDQATATLQKIDKGVKAIEGSTAKATASFSNLDKGIEKVNNTASTLRNILATVVAGAATKQLFDLVNSYEKLAVSVGAFAVPGSNTKELLKEISTLASNLGVDAKDLTNAFINLRQDGASATAQDLTALRNIAALTGSSVTEAADAIGKAVDGNQKALKQFGIEIEKDAFGRYLVKFQNNVIGVANSSAEAGRKVLEFAATNETILKAGEQAANGLDAAYTRLVNTLSGSVKESGLETSLTNLINVANESLTNGVLKEAMMALGKAVQFVADNFDILTKAITIVAGVWAGAKIGGWALILLEAAAGVLTLAKNLRTLGTTAAIATAIATGGLSALLTIIGGTAGAIAAYNAAEAVFEKVDKAQSDTAKSTQEATNASNKSTEAVNKQTEAYKNLNKQIQTKSKNDSSEKSDAVKAYEAVIAGPVKAYDQLAVTLKAIPELRKRANGSPAEFAQYIAAAQSIEQLQKQLGILREPVLSAEDVFRGLSNQLAFSRAEATRNVEIFEKLDAEFERFLGRENYGPSIRELSIYVKAMQNLGIESLNTKQKLLLFQAQIALESTILADNEKVLDGLIESYRVGAAVIEKLGGNIYTANGPIRDMREAFNKLKGEFDVMPFEAIIFGAKGSAEQLKVMQDRANELFFAFKAGTLSIEEYRFALQQLQGIEVPTTFEEITLDVNRSVRAFDNASKNAKRLRDEVAAGNVDWKQYQEYVSAIGSEHFPEYERQLRKLTPLQVELGNTIERSATQASDAFADSFLEILKKGEFTFRSFRDMIENIFNDIARLVIRKAFADPIADAIAGILKGASSGLSLPGGGSGGFGNIFGSIGSAIGGSFGTSLRYGTNFGSQQTAMLAAQDAGMGSSFFSGITDFFSGLWPFAEGGIVTRPTMGLVGEAGPEAVIPLNQYNSMMSGGSSQPKDAPPPVNFTINAIDTQTGVEFLLKNKPAIIKVVQDAYNTRGRRGPLEA